MTTILDWSRPHGKLKPFGYTAITVYLALLICVGIVVQYATVKILLSPHFRMKKLTPYLLNIVLANSIVILGSFPTTFAAAVNNGWPFSEFVCRLNGLLTAVGCIAMLLTMTCITWKIYVTASTTNVNNFIAPSAFRRYHIHVIIAIWLFSACVVLPPTVGWSNMRLESASLNCVPDWAPETLNDVIYILLMTVLGYFLPVILSVVLLFRTRTVLRNHTKVLKCLIIPNIRLKALLHVYRMQFLSVICFTLTWLPYVVYVFVSLAYGSMYIFGPALTTLPALVAKSSVVLNPVIYAIVIPRFRESFVRFFWCPSRSNVLPVTAIQMNAFVVNKEVANKKTYQIPAVNQPYLD
ncbi:rhodopsin [Exaiptasia diaphana]|uniref:G-protein coupled receptors family 1 profile domain-containing protein n=2 Tax=Exaiptasia diaphana TaxID=2652724 RepID=A0A913YQK4_EXADI|nr:rhodopsin [Exaiptasia diaphana]